MLVARGVGRKLLIRDEHENGARVARVLVTIESLPVEMTNSKLPVAHLLRP